jgi:outer membrane protein OmpA-like peptidoglycan-associated protein
MRPAFRFITFSAILLLIQVSIKAQNLVENPGFEIYVNYMDSNHVLVFSPKYWHYDHRGSFHPIYYCTDRFRNHSFSWNEHPDSINIRRGFTSNFLILEIFPWPQQAYTRLKEPLQKGKRYHMKADVKPSLQSNFLSDLPTGFKMDSISPGDTLLYEIKLSLPDTIDYDSVYDKWITVKTDFVASGDEKWLVISSGTRKENNNQAGVRKNKDMLNDELPPQLNYYIDNVYLVASEKTIPFFEKMDSLKIGESLVLQNIYFDFDRYNLTTASYPALNELYDYLVGHGDCKICISGFTDSIGSAIYNKRLSLNRAEALSAYLTARGIAVSRIATTGFGSDFPVDSNKSEESRKQNRRIEIMIMEK